MTDRPIMFSGPMVRALLEGRKTQTRRLATSPLRKCVVGDRLWVRETWRWDDYAPGEAIHQADAPADVLADTKGIIKWRPSIHMVRAVSRLTLVVTGVKVEPLRSISNLDAHDEGATRTAATLAGIATPPSEEDPNFYRVCFEGLWTWLHGRESWQANPEVVALTFTVHRANIDKMNPESPHPVSRSPSPASV